MKTRTVARTRAGKKPYTKPRLTRYGDLKTLTRGGNRTGKEGVFAASPKTKVPGFG